MKAIELICEEVRLVLKDKGIQDCELNGDTVFLDGSIEFDSIDLASLIVSLEESTGLQPFRNGFVMFRTVGELAHLFTDDKT